MLDAWDSAVEFLLVDDRARNLARTHPLMVDGRAPHAPGVAALLPSWRPRP